MGEGGKEGEEGFHKKSRAGRGHSPYQVLEGGGGGTKGFFCLGMGSCLSRRERGSRVCWNQSKVFQI